jgi:demethylmenaquinone methyltransferase/2-methoxy-6-polyprenyl-1,4-benzoquinol methylase
MDTINDNRQSPDFAGQVNRMFDRVAGRYDALNSVMTAGLHHRWRERAADRAGLKPGDAALDVCCGTGDLALALRRRVGGAGRVAGVDFAAEMLAVARRKSAEVEWIEGDALALPFADGAFAAATVGFGMRNLPDHGAGFAEMARVVRPGGRVVCLELTEPPALIAPFSRLWSDRMVPLLGRLVAGDADAYRYLPASIHAFPRAAELARVMVAAGLVDVRHARLFPGVVALHAGTVPA